MNREWSDHSPIKVVLDGRERIDGTRMRSFRFEQIWVGEDGCEDTIKKTWEEEDWNVVDTIARCARELQKWKGVSIGKIMRDLNRKRRRLEWLNISERTVGNVRERKAVIKDINSLLRQEEIFWRQRSRALWLKEVHASLLLLLTVFPSPVVVTCYKLMEILHFIILSFYHHSPTAFRTSEELLVFYLLMDSGSLPSTSTIPSPPVSEPVAPAVATSSALVTTAASVVTSTPARPLTMLERGFILRFPTPGMVPPRPHQLATTPSPSRAVVTEEGTLTPLPGMPTLCQMHPLKAPGPDGMNALFYQTYWHIVGPSVTRLVLRILNGSESHRIVNSTHIVLFPKKKAPDKFIDYRPISLCNVLYKLVAKVLANRLKQFLGSLDSENQSAFTPGRLISDNILIAFDMFHYMKNARSGGGHMALKLDMAKAYDRVKWVFLEKVLLTMGFARNWVEVLSSMIRRKVEEGVIHGIRVAPLLPVVSHLFFADDSIIFVKAYETQARVVLGLLSQYESASGQLVSKEKTTVSFSKGTAACRRDKVSSVLGVQVVQEQGKYLGLPTVIGHSKQVLNKIVRDKLHNKMQGWRAQYIPTYAMSVFKLPANFCAELHSIVSRFWWGSDNGKRKISWVAWEAMCRAKAGGMGFRDFGQFNLAILVKQAWRLICDEGSLMVRVLKGKYFPNCSFMDAVVGNNSSYTWRIICDARQVMGLGVRRRIGDGKGTRVWLDPRIPGTSSRCVISPQGDFDLEMKVEELMVAREARWDMERVEAMFLPFEAERIMNIHLSELVQEDSWCWDGAREGEYLVWEGYRLLAAEDSDEGRQSDTAMGSWLWKAIWGASMLPRIKVFMWQLCSDALPESCIHVVRDCGWNEEVWEMVKLKVFRNHGSMCIREWVEVELRRMGEEERVIFVTSCWLIWEKRNKMLFDNGMWTGEGVVRRVTDVVWEMASLLVERVEKERGRGESTADGRWGRPSDGMWKINVDAGVKEGMGVGLRAVCRDGDGRVAWAVAVQAAGTCCVQMAEAEAILLGLKEARRVGMRSVIIERDCLNVVAALKKRTKGRSDIFLIYDEILSLIPFFDSISFNYTRRDCNKLAYLVAHAIPWTIGRRFWLDDLPMSFVNVAEQNLINI
ncbi:uncharacterized protein LOC141614678 [Silene latifolia]|uniref:uncharacterized protein LOC141614678 n=1 Tax=Silene latifolia TaxID=37657 RepID=UPI003D780E62